MKNLTKMQFKIPIRLVKMDLVVIFDDVVVIFFKITPKIGKIPSFCV